MVAAGSFMSAADVMALQRQEMELRETMKKLLEVLEMQAAPLNILQNSHWLKPLWFEHPH